MPPQPLLRILLGVVSAFWIRHAPCAAAPGFAVGSLPQLRIAIAFRSDIAYLNRHIPRGLGSQLIRKMTNTDFHFKKNYTVKQRLRENEDILALKYYSPPEVLDGLCRVILENNASVLLFLQDDTSERHSLSEKYILQMTGFLGLPVLAFSGMVQPSSQSSFLQLTPSIRHQCLAMLSLLKRYNWREFSIVTGSIPGNTYFVNTLRDLAENSRYEIMTIVQINSYKESTIEKGLNKLKLAETRVILLYASRKQASKILVQATKKGLTGREFIWILSQTATEVYYIKEEPAYHPELPPGLFGLYFPTNRETKIKTMKIAVDIFLQGVENLFRDMERNASMRDVTLSPNFRCIEDPKTGNKSIMIPKKWHDGQYIYEYMKKVVIPSEVETEEGNTPINIAFNDDGTLTDSILKIYNLDMDHKWNEIGLWSTMEGLTINDITWPDDNPTPPEGRPAKYQLKVVTLQEQPYVVYSNPDQAGQCPPQAQLCRIAPENETIGVANATSNSSLYQCCSGFCIDLLNKLSESIGFEFELFQVEDGIWGSFDTEKGQWNGLVRSIMDGKADMVMTSLKITPERNSVIDFSMPFLETGITIIVAVRDGVISPTAFLEPFDLTSWLFILLMSINIISIGLFVFEWMSPSGYHLKMSPPPEPYDYPSWCLILVFSVHASGTAIFIFEWLSPSGLDRGNKPIREHRFSLFRSFWLIWSILFGAAVNVDNPRGVSSRFLGNIWALFAVVFTASYTANLAAFMITKEDYDRLTGIQDWRLTNPQSHKPPFKFATIPHGSTDTNIQKNYPKMYQWMKPFNKSDVKTGVNAVKNGEINAFIYDATVLEYRAAHDEGCRLRTVGSWYAMTGYGVGFPKGSKWIDRVNLHLAQYQYDGYMERLQKFWLAGACKKGSEEGEHSMPLGILNFTSAFILLAGGMLLGGLLLLLEHIYFKFFRAKLRRWDKCGCCSLVSLSMGKSLTFEQSVREAIELQKHFKCKNPICETQVWKLKHELDLALLRIERLQKQASERGITYEKRAVWKDSGHRSEQLAPPIEYKKEALQLPLTSAGGRRAAGVGPPSGSRPRMRESSSCQDCTPSARHPSTWDDDYYQYHPQHHPAVEYHPSSATRGRPGVPRTVPRTDTSSASGASISSQGTPRVNRGDDKNVKGSKSLPSSPIRRPVAGPSAQLESTVVPYGHRALDRGTLSSHDLRARDSKYQTNRIPLARAQRLEGAVEKETVL